MSNFTIEDTAQLWTWKPYGDGSIAGGWASFYAISGFNNQPGEASRGDSSHLTSLDGASASLTFMGSSIILFGTANCSYEVSVDGVTPATIFSPPSPSILYENPSLSNSSHTIALIAHPTNKDGTQVFGIDKAIITVPFDDNATAPTVVYNSNTSWITYEPPDEWTVPPVDAQIPSLSNPIPYHETKTAHAFARLDWIGGDGVAVRGVSNYGHWTYTVTLDGVSVLYNSSSWWLVPDALLFFQPFSSSANSSTPHSLIISNAADKMIFSLNYITFYGEVSQLSSNLTSNLNTTTSTNPTQTHTSGSHTNAGVVIGPITAVLAALGLMVFFLMCHCRHRWREEQTVAEVVTPYDPPAHPIPVPQGSRMYQRLKTFIPLITDPWSQNEAQRPETMRLPPTNGFANIAPPPISVTPSSSPLFPAGGRRIQGSKRGAAIESYNDPRSQDTGRSPPGPSPLSSTPNVDVDRIMDLIVQRIDLSPRARRQAGDAEAPPGYSSQL